MHPWQGSPPRCASTAADYRSRDRRLSAPWTTQDEQPSDFHAPSSSPRYARHAVCGTRSCSVCRRALWISTLFSRTACIASHFSAAARTSPYPIQADRRRSTSSLTGFHRDLRKGQSSCTQRCGPAMAGEVVMNPRDTMLSKVNEYLTERRRAGFALSIPGKQLLGFARFADRSGYRGPLTVDLASRWALANRRGLALTAARRIDLLRSFARYCQ